MKFKNKPGSTFLWWLCGIIPILHLYWVWKVSKILTNMEYERGD